MALTFHCEHCVLKIKAPDNAGGKWGKRIPADRNLQYLLSSTLATSRTTPPQEEISHSSNLLQLLTQFAKSTL